MGFSGGNTTQRQQWVWGSSRLIPRGIYFDLMKFICLLTIQQNGAWRSLSVDASPKIDKLTGTVIRDWYLR